MLRKIMMIALVTMGIAGCRAHAGGHVGSVGAGAGVAAGHR
jgi:hypothetical protein